MLTATRTRRGVSLLELLVVVVLMGIFASTVSMRFGRSLFSEFGSEAEARKLSLALLQAQRAAITSGDNHYVQFDSLSATSFQVMRRNGGGDVLVDGPHSLSPDVSTTASHTVMEFTFEGQALSPYTLDVVGVDRAWQVRVVPVSGAINVVETTP